ncbi:CaiB/BaiF CoA transferase family protein [Gandjariella thermophila]|uniref:CoA transferase n=1 Tax=Gandjariella thermophila TaxID=1931992 RepID=A0A4D4J7E0_9PSEU|nr:CaiB/BaiF CoA-transferase family protein [Gandjariella thermophila]GDY32715.1 CoA transferase [Gandjariella thermophila]
MSSPLPLEGVTVLDFTQVYLGPAATQMLGDYGADVIKVERPGTGDLSRTSITDPAGLDNPVFLSINRNKRSISIDTRAGDGRQVIRDLAREVDVVVSNFRPGVMERLGLGYDDLRAINPRIIWASGTGFGTDGPYRHKGGQDVLAQAYTGVMWRRASDDIPLNIYPTTLCDYTTGMHLVQGILLALLARERTGEGQKVEVAMYDSMLHMQMQEACTQLNRGREVNWAAMPLTGVFATTDGAVCLVGAFKENPLRDICVALELGEDLSARPEFATQEAQAEHRAELRRIFRDRFATNTTEYWIKRLEDQDLLCAPVRTLVEALADEQTAVNGMVVEMDHPAAGRFRALNAPVHLSATPARVRRVPPRLGEHGAEILAEHGYPADRVAALRDQGVLR